MLYTSLCFLLFVLAVEVCDVVAASVAAIVVMFVTTAAVASSVITCHYQYRNWATSKTIPGVRTIKVDVVHVDSDATIVVDAIHHDVAVVAAFTIAAAAVAFAVCYC